MHSHTYGGQKHNRIKICRQRKVGRYFCTFNTLVRRLEVRFEVLGTRLVLGELRIRYAYLAASAAGAACVGQFEHVRLAAEMSVV